MTGNFLFFNFGSYLVTVGFVFSFILLIMNCKVVICLIILVAGVKTLKLNREKPSTVWGLQKKLFRQKVGEYFRSSDGAYQFQYDTGNAEHQIFRNEKRYADGTIVGFFGYIDPEGILRITEYMAGIHGYRQRTVLRYPVDIDSYEQI